MTQFIDDVIQLRNFFKITESKRWDFHKGVNELIVQLGHLGLVMHKEKDNEGFNEVNERGRIIDKIDDELCDCLLQIIPLMMCVNFSKKEMEDIIFSESEKVSDIIPHVEYIKMVIITAQLLESAMKINFTRFARSRDASYISEENFIRDRALKILDCLLKLFSYYKIDISLAFYHMYEDATQFLSHYKDFAKKNQLHFRELERLGLLIDKRINEFMDYE